MADPAVMSIDLDNKPQSDQMVETESRLAMSMHEFKSKLTVVAALSDVVSRAHNLTAEQAGRLKMVADSARFIADGLHELIDHSLTEHPPIPGVKNIDMCELVSRAVRECRPLFELKNQTLELNYSCNEFVVCDYESLLESVRNLLTNASKHTQVGSRTYLSVGNQSGCAYIELVDNGPGFTAETKQAVTTFHGRSSSRSTVEGNGVGLAMVRQTALSHDGTFTVDSIRGSGSVFTLTFPVASA
jgi:signal transduction histidine kinase